MHDDYEHTLKFLRALVTESCLVFLVRTQIDESKNTRTTLEIHCLALPFLGHPK
jgi:hypothetical protein